MKLKYLYYSVLTLLFPILFIPLFISFIVDFAKNDENKITLKEYKIFCFTICQSLLAFSLINIAYLITLNLTFVMFVYLVFSFNSVYILNNFINKPEE